MSWSAPLERCARPKRFAFGQPPANAGITGTRRAVFIPRPEADLAASAARRLRRSSAFPRRAQPSIPRRRTGICRSARRLAGQNSAGDLPIVPSGLAAFARRQPEARHPLAGTAGAGATTPQAWPVFPSNQSPKAGAPDRIKPAKGNQTQRALALLF
jgi:hypothetical protein